MECDICGFDYLKSELTKNSDGFWVCAKDFEVKHPRLFNTVRREKTLKGD